MYGQQQRAVFRWCEDCRHQWWGLGLGALARAERMFEIDKIDMRLDAHRRNISQGHLSASQTVHEPLPCFYDVDYEHCSFQKHLLDPWHRKF